MSLLDNVRQTLSDVTGTVVEQGKQLGAQTQLQMAIKKLQLERAKRIHELGKQTYDWYRTGQLVVTGQVPSGISELCRQLDDIEHQVQETETQMDQLRLQAMQNPSPTGAPGTAPQTQIVVTTPATSANDAATAQPAPGAAVVTPPPTSHDTQVLSDNDAYGASRPGPGPGA